jgi:hypothetical protein
MKKFLPAIAAIVMALGFSAFTSQGKSSHFLLYFKNTGPDKAHAVWVPISGQPAPSDCLQNSGNYCYGTAESGSEPTIKNEGDYVGPE